VGFYFLVLEPNNLSILIAICTFKKLFTNLLFMRILVELLPHGNYDYSSINKHHIQAIIYSMLKQSPFDVLHNLRGFKYFTFSDIMPPTDFREGNKEYTLHYPKP